MGFVSPIFISKLDTRQIDANQHNNQVNIFESEPIPYDSSIIQKIRSKENVKRVEPVLYRPALMYSKEITRKISITGGKDSTYQFYENKDVLCKGVNAEYNWDFLKKYLVKGRIGALKSNHLVISENIAKNLNFKIGDEVDMGFITNAKQGLQKFHISGIYKTDFQDYDEHLIFGNLSEIQKNAGLKVVDQFSVEFDDFSEKKSLKIRSNIIENKVYIQLFKEDGDFKLENTEVPIHSSGSFTIFKQTNVYDNFVENTAYRVKISSKDNTEYSQEFLESLNEVKGNFTNNILVYDSLNKNNYVSIRIEVIQNPNMEFISGYEIGLNELNALEETRKVLQNEIGLNANSQSKFLQASTVFEVERDLFVWLKLLDLNVYVIIILMLIIGVVNAGSAIIVVIALKRNFIGILKALGANNWSIRKIFLYHAGTIILKGLIIGNLIGLLLIFVQDSFKLIRLDPEIYYLNHVPMNYSWQLFIFLNVLSFVICLACLIIPTYLVSKINPIKSIKFN